MPVMSNHVKPAHPGKVLATELVTRKLTANALALKLHVPATRIYEIVHGHRSISPETALRLGRCFGINPQFFIYLQAHYDVAIATQQFGETIEREVEPL